MTKPVPQQSTVSGKVVYGDATLYAGVTLTLTADGATAPAASTVVNADGSYAFPTPMAVGPYLLAAHKDLGDGSYLGAAEEIEVAGTTTAVADLTLVRTVA